MSKHILGLDIGSSTICASLCNIGKHHEVQLRGVGHAPAAGLQKGKIQSVELLQKAIEKAIQKAELSAGFRAEEVVLSIPVCHIHFQTSTGLMPAKHRSGKIKDSEKMECVKRSQSDLASEKHLILHTFPIQFKVDGIPIADPVGKKGVHLEVYSYSVLGAADTITTLSHILKRRRLVIRGVLYEAMAHAELMLTEAEKDSGSLLIDIGGKFTKLSLFEKNVLQKSLFFPIGGDTVTADIAYCLKLSAFDAEKLKRQAVNLILDAIDPNDTIEFISQDHSKRFINTLYLSRIVHARLAELFTLIKTQYPSHTMPATIVLVGGTSRLKGLVEFSQTCLNKPIQLGMTDTLQARFKKPEIACAAGLVIYHQKLQTAQAYRARGKDPLSRFNKWFKEFF